MLRIQNELESKIRRLQQKEIKVWEEWTPMRVTDSQTQVLNDIKLDNDRLTDKETEHQERFAIREGALRDIQREL